MIDNLQETKLEELIEKVVAKSHMSIAQVQSNGLGDIKSKLAVHTEILSRIEKTQNEMIEQNKIRNGRIEKLEHDRDTSSGWVKGLGIAIGIILTLAVTIFELRLSAVAKVSADTQGMLIEHVKSANDYLKTLK